MIKAVVFDYDGVIADSFGVVFEITNRILEYFGKQQVSLDEYRRIFGANWRQFYMDRGLSTQELKQEEKIFRKEMEAVRHQIGMFDGIDYVIERLGKKYKLGVVSNNYREYVIDFLRKQRLRHYFDSVIGYMPDAHKPDPKQLFICLDDLEVKPEETCVIGDTRDEIVMSNAAKVAKMIAVSYGYHMPDMLQDADHIVHTPHEILQILEAL